MEKNLKYLRKWFSKAIVDHGMIQDGDRILVGLSGGKDSWALLSLLADLKPRAPIRYDLEAITIDGGLTGLNPGDLEKTCARLDTPFHLSRQKIFETVAEKKDEGSTFCSMCAKLRRGALYTAARNLGSTKIALGHHLDDAMETLFLNLFFGGRVASLPPVLPSNAGNVPIIRPLLYCEESLLAGYVQSLDFPIVGCACPVCPTHPEYEYSDLRRHQMKAWIGKLKAEMPHLHQRFRGALQNVEPERFLDKSFNFLPNSSFPPEESIRID